MRLFAGFVESAALLYDDDTSDIQLDFSMAAPDENILKADALEVK